MYISNMSKTLDTIIGEDKWVARDGVQVGAEVVASALSNEALQGMASGYSALAHIGARVAERLGVPEDSVKKF